MVEPATCAAFETLRTWPRGCYRCYRLTPAERIGLGTEGRRKMEREYDEALVIDRYLQALRGFSSG